eukprot:gene3629-7226_t
MNVDINCIPALGITVIADPSDYIPRILKSIDYCIHTVVIVHSFGLYVNESIAMLRLSSHVRNVHVFHDSRYLFGVSEGWNIILEYTKHRAPWIVMCAFDIFFPPGELQKISRTYWNEYLKTAGNVFAFVNYLNFNTSLAAYNTFVVSHSTILKIGTFDENFFPAFYEDSDWSVRLRLGAVKVITLETVKLWHGDSPRNGTVQNAYFSGTRLFVNALPYWDAISRYGIRHNRIYFQKKWNCSYSIGISINTSQCQHSTPFGNHTYNISTWIKNSTAVEGVRTCLERPLFDASEGGRKPLSRSKRGMYVKSFKVRYFMGIFNENCTHGVIDVRGGRRIPVKAKRPQRHVLECKGDVENMYLVDPDVLHQTRTMLIKKNCFHNGMPKEVEVDDKHSVRAL